MNVSGLIIYRIPSLKVEGGPLSNPEELFRYSTRQDRILGLSRVHTRHSIYRRLVMRTEMGVSEILFHSDGSAVVTRLFRLEDTKFDAAECNVGSSKVIGIQYSSVLIYQILMPQSNPIRCDIPPGGKCFVLMDEITRRVVLYEHDTKIVSILEYSDN